MNRAVGATDSRRFSSSPPSRIESREGPRGTSTSIVQPILPQSHTDQEISESISVPEHELDVAADDGLVIEMEEAPTQESTDLIASFEAGEAAFRAARYAQDALEEERATIERAFECFHTENDYLTRKQFEAMGDANKKEFVLRMEERFGNLMTGADLANREAKRVLAFMRDCKVWQVLGQSEDEYFAELPRYQELYNIWKRVRTRRISQIKSIYQNWGAEGSLLINRGVSRTLDETLDVNETDESLILSHRFLIQINNLARRVPLKTAAKLYRQARLMSRPADRLLVLQEPALRRANKLLTNALVMRGSEWRTQGKITYSANERLRNAAVVEQDIIEPAAQRYDWVKECRFDPKEWSMTIEMSSTQLVTQRNPSPESSDAQESEQRTAQSPLMPAAADRESTRDDAEGSRGEHEPAQDNDPSQDIPSSPPIAQSALRRKQQISKRQRTNTLDSQNSHSTPGASENDGDDTAAFDNGAEDIADGTEDEVQPIESHERTPTDPGCSSIAQPASRGVNSNVSRKRRATLNPKTPYIVPVVTDDEGDASAEQADNDDESAERSASQASESMQIEIPQTVPFRETYGIWRNSDRVDHLNHASWEFVETCRGDFSADRVKRCGRVFLSMLMDYDDYKWVWNMMS